MKFTQIPQDTFKELVLNAGVLLSAFSPDTAEVADDTIIGATSGGLTFAATPSFSDFGEDIDNCPKNIKYSCVMFQDIHGYFAKWAYYPAIAS